MFEQACVPQSYLPRWAKSCLGEPFRKRSHTKYLQIHAVKTHSTTSTFRSCVSLQSTEGYLLSHEEFRSHLANNIAEHSWCEVNSVEREVAEDTGIQSKPFHQSEGSSYETNSHPSWNQENSQQRLHTKGIVISIEQIQPYPKNEDDLTLKNENDL